MGGQLIMSIIYDINPRSEDDPYLNLAAKALEGLTLAGVPGAFLVDSFSSRKSSVSLKTQIQKSRSTQCDTFRLGFLELVLNTKRRFGASMLQI